MLNGIFEFAQWVRKFAILRALTTDTCGLSGIFLLLSFIRAATILVFENICPYF